jgi:threonine dehydrogenase-like Zn-dependent dehydrogenase
MRALTIRPPVADSLRLDEVCEPDPRDGPVLVDGISVGMCGTDLELVRGENGAAPPGADRLILGHENRGR